MMQPLGGSAHRPAGVRGSRSAAVGLVLLVLAVLPAADRPDPVGPPKPETPVGLDALKLPPGTVIIVSDRSREALQKIDAVVLSPDKYRELLDRIDQLSKQVNPDKPDVPSVCRLSGKVETRGTQEVVRLHAVFEFRAAVKATFTLGCQNAKPVGVTLDDNRVPILRNGDKGLFIQVESAGAHKLTLELEVVVQSPGGQGAERGFELDLPGSAITTLERFEVPAKVTKVRVGGRTLPATLLAAPGNSQPALVLGPTTKLDANWEVPASTRQEPLRAAEGRVRVRVEDTRVTTEARLTLKPLRGLVGEWKILTPPGAEVTIDPAGRGGVLPEGPFELAATVERPDPKKGVWRVRLKEPDSQEIHVDVRVQTPRPATGPHRTPVGPFVVLDAFQQKGRVVLTAGPPMRLRYHPRGELRREALAADEATANAAFSYQLPRMSENQAVSPLLEVESEPVPGRVQTQLLHRLMLAEAGWRLATEVKVTPGRTELDHLDFEVPAELQELRVGPADWVEGEPVPQRDLRPGWKLVRVYLAGGRNRGPFALTLEGLYAQSADARQATLGLPRPARAADASGQVTATVPAGWEVRGSAREWEQDRPGSWEYPLEGPAGAGPAARVGTAAYASRRALAQVELTWGPYRPALTAEGVVDLTLGDRQAHVRHQLRFASAESPRRVTLVGPAELTDRVRANGGWTLTAVRPGEWTVAPTAGADGSAVVFSYSVPLPAGAGRSAWAVPLLWPASATRCETRLRVWNAAEEGPGLRPTLAGGPWEEQPTEVVPECDQLPALVLHGSGRRLPLALALTEATGVSPARAVAERVLIQVWLNDAGQQVYRARFLLRRLTPRALELELPAAPAALALEAYLEGKRVEPIAEAGGAAGASPMVRLELPPAGRGAAATVLDVRYQLSAADRQALGGSGGSGDVAFYPVRLRGPVLLGQVRWQVGMPAGSLPLYLGGSATVEQRWNWQRGLWVPLAARGGAELDHWFLAGTDAPQGPDESPPAGAGEVTLLARVPALAPLALTVLPRPAAMLAASLLVLAAGLGLARLRRDRAWVWLTVAGPGLVVAVAAVVWPQAGAQLLSAAQPGLLGLVAILGVGAYLRRRARRRREVLPSFTRSATGSSLVRSGSSRARPTDGSTIDAPPGSNLPSGSDIRPVQSGS